MEQILFQVGIVGKCMGGALALAAAVKLEDVITAAVTFYGIPDQIVYDCREIKIPVQVLGIQFHEMLPRNDLKSED